MKACVATGEKGQMECREVPEPSLEAGALLLKTKCALICGSDLEYLEGLHGKIVPGEIRGHEFVAEVAAVGGRRGVDRAGLHSRHLGGRWARKNGHTRSFYL